MSTHQATEQMLGYLYQVRYALSLLLENDNTNFQISIEKFDDVTFCEDGLPKQLIQLKHHVNSKGSLTDGSSDLWRTLKVWIDMVSADPDLIDGTEFLIVTTAIAPDGTAASLLKKDNNRNVEAAYDKLKNVCLCSKNEDHEKYYRAFCKADEAVIKRLISQICVIDDASDIIDVEKTIRKPIRYSCIPKFEEQIFERLEGWWYKKAIECLCSDTPIFITQSQVRTFIVSVSQEYSDDNLPIEIFDIGDLDEMDLGTSEKIFYEQLKLICLGNRHMKTALFDYYRTFKQRASWVRNDLLYIDELEKYEQRLIDEWQHAFAAMEDDLAENDKVTEMDKAKEGRKLFSVIEGKNIRIRPRCQEAFVMRGSYHMLANQLKVGWHIDFYERLKNLLDT